MFKFAAVIVVAALAVLVAMPADADHCKGKHKNDPGCDGGGAKVVFASSDDTLTGNLGGVAGADATCNTLAVNAGLSGNFKAWLGTWVPLGSNPLSHFTHSSGPYVLTDETLVARDFFQLISGVLENHITSPRLRGRWSVRSIRRTGPFAPKRVTQRLREL